MLLALALCLTRDELDPAAIPAPTSAWPAPSALVGAIVGRQLAHIHRIVRLAKDGVPCAELDRLGAEENERIRRDLIEPHGEAGQAAAEEAGRRLLGFLHTLAADLGTTLDTP